MKNIKTVVSISAIALLLAVSLILLCLNNPKSRTESFVMSHHAELEKAYGSNTAITLK